MTAPDAAWRGDRRLRVTLELSERATRVTGVALLEGPAVQRPTLTGSLAVRVDVGGELALVDAFDDPRAIRGASRPEIREHRLEQSPTGIVIIEVPLFRERALGRVAIHLADVSGIPRRSTDPAVVAGYFAKRTRGLRRRPAVTLEHLALHPDWERIGPGLGVPPVSRAAFEIYRDRQRRFRWRLRRPDGQIVADSGEGYADRAACERDLQWIRSHGLRVEIRSLDLGGT